MHCRCDSFRSAQLESHETTLKILCWNINKNNQSSQWAQEFDSLLSRYQPDVICLQEVRLPDSCCQASPMSAYLSDTLQHKAAIDAMGWCFAPNFQDTIAQTYSGVLTGAKVSSTNSTSLLTQSTEPITQTPKASLLTTYSLQSQLECENADSLLIVNTHLINFVGVAQFQSQLDQIGSAIAQHNGAVILAGDFNTWSRDRMERLQRCCCELNLIQATFSSQDTARIKRFLLSSPLDHIFYRGFDQVLSEAKVIDPIYASDHRPLVIELTRRF